MALKNIHSTVYTTRRTTTDGEDNATVPMTIMITTVQQQKYILVVGGE